MANNILVTGATGFMGTPLMEILGKHHAHRNLFGVARQRGKGPGRYLQCDLSNRKKTRQIIQSVKPRIIYHAAGVPSTSTKKDLEKSYLNGTASLFEAIRGTALLRCRVVVVGSVVEYGAQPKIKLPLTEDSPNLPQTPYAQIKLAQTHMALASMGKGLDVMVGRVFNLFGPGCPPHLAVGSWGRQIAGIEKKRIPPLIKVGNLNVIRDFIDVRDAARALTFIGNKGYPGEIYNVCTGKGLKLRDILETLLNLSNFPHKIQVEIEPSRIRKSGQEMTRVYGSSKKLRAHTGWKPQIGLKTSLLDTLQDIRL